MFKDLPEFVQKQVLNYLANDNLSAARALHDAWMRNKRLPTTSSRSRKTNGDTIIAQDFLPKQKIDLIERMLNKSEIE